MFIHEVARPVGKTMVSQMVLYNFLTAQNDLWQSIHDAIMDYCTTPEGRQRVANGQMMTYADFLDYVPAETCKKHGFERILASAEAKHYDGQQPMIDKRDMVYFLQQRDQAQEREAEIQRIVPQLAKAMADMRSAPKMDKWSFWQIANAAIQWSTEYVDSGESDLRGFVRRKLDALAAPKPAKKGEVQA